MALFRRDFSLALLGIGGSGGSFPIPACRFNPPESKLTPKSHRGTVMLKVARDCRSGVMEPPAPLLTAARPGRGRDGA